MIPVNDLDQNLLAISAAQLQFLGLQGLAIESLPNLFQRGGVPFHGELQSGADYQLFPRSLFTICRTDIPDLIF